jgi:opacity protein-like surface antigen
LPEKLLARYTAAIRFQGRKLTKAFWTLAAVAWWAVAAVAWAQAPTAPPAAPAPGAGTVAEEEAQSSAGPVAEGAAPEPSAMRWISFSLDAEADCFLDRQTRTVLGPVVYGAGLQLEYRPTPWFGISGNVAYLVGEAKSDAALQGATYRATFRRLADVTMTPVNLGLHANLLPGGRANPYIGATVGGVYLATHLEPQQIRSPIPLNYDELNLNIRQWLPAFGGEVGVDVRITTWFGVFVTGFYRYVGVANAPYSIPGASATVRLPLSDAGARLGLIAYY